MKLAVVDGDGDVRIAINRLLRAPHHEVSLFASTEEFAPAHPDAEP
jgi:FixJ family two-component response regulator